MNERLASSMLPYIVVEATGEWCSPTGTLQRRWVIVDGRGETVSPPVPRQNAFKWCAALMWWFTAFTKEQQESCSAEEPKH